MIDEIWVDGKVEAWRDSIIDKPEQARTRAWSERLRERQLLDSQKSVYCVSAGMFTFGVLAIDVTDAMRLARTEYRMHRETDPKGVEFHAERV
jgi:hypothetical protein